MNVLPVLLSLTIVLTSGLVLTEVYAEITPNSPFLLDGSGYLITEKSIKASNMNILLNTAAKSGSQINIVIENGLVTMGNSDYMIKTSSATSLREGKLVRISATAESSSRGEITISLIGKLVQDSNEGSVYTFTGRITEGNTEYKTVYIGQLSDPPAPPPNPKPTDQPKEDEPIVVHIQKGSSQSDFGADHTGYVASHRAGYFSVDRLTLAPETTVTFVNDDDVAHTLVSGSGLAGTRPTGDLIICMQEDELNPGASYSQNNCDFTLDGRLDSKVIAPGGSWQATFSDAGLYRLIDPEYPWMRLVAFVFPESDSTLIRQGNNQLGN